MVLLELGDLIEHLLEDSVGAEVVELSEGLVDPLGVWQTRVEVAVGLVLTGWLTLEDDFLQLVQVILLTACLLHGSSEAPIEVEHSLLPGELSSGVSALHKLFDQPLEHRQCPLEVKSLDLMRCNLEWAFHFLKSHSDLLSTLDLFSHRVVIFKFNIHIVVGTCDTPAHRSENLVEGVDIQPGSEVTSGDD